MDRQGTLPDPGSRALGIAERALQMAIDYANTRETFGRKIGANQAIQWMIADSEVELEAARWLVLHAAWTVDQGRDPRHASSMAKLYGAAMANEVVDRVLQIHGGMGYTRELPIERWYREARLLAHLRGHRRDAATDHLPRPAARLHHDRRAPGLAGLRGGGVLSSLLGGLPGRDPYGWSAPSRGAPEP